MAIKKHWFKKAGWMYHPVTWQGMALTVVLLIFLAHIYLIVDTYSRSFAETLYGIFPFWVPAILVWLWVGSHTSSD
ncbi:MAG TPA: hypothetical protein VK145_00995 [Candidatus Nanoarchaeia archaeon]|nr:hypothetical protein [Candidatus Nanoarchaeia archaeon]